ncbi:PREDICTED: thioredoxin domain-containing protein 5-like [Papilio xuthus]|uniref:Thioredoxin domain-containing protein 5 n=1 Tax=Papilio xuthus TaxID=66420 RepID=A0A194QFL9_PAPXU|nr:PREDICTED: thioredoxin domain-containing protein 5-like [Papilio xuthus]KPJ04338.1 Thioredoxin domain-containing protein 5 [Papilio xuthus]
MIVNLNYWISLFLFLPRFVTPEDGTIYEYNPDNFRGQIEDMDGNFIMFYAPWCRHCTEFQPIWVELAELINTKDSKFAIAQVDCTLHPKLCQETDITGYPTLLYFHKNSFSPVEYKGTRDLPSLTLFLSEVFAMKSGVKEADKSNEVKIYSGMAYLTDQNIEKFVSKGQHFVMFYMPWCKTSQRLAPVWAELAVHYAHSEYIQIGKVNCLDNEITCKSFDIKQYPHLLWIFNGRIMGVSEVDTLEKLKAYVDRMMLAENHDPDKFMKKKKTLPVARITEETFETFLEKDLVFVNFFAPWCAHCMQLNPLWLKLGEKFQNESRVLIADIDCVRSKNICEMEKISGLPTLILYKHKKIVSIENGSKPLENLVNMIKEHLDEELTNENESKLKDEENILTKDEL